MQLKTNMLKALEQTVKRRRKHTAHALKNGVSTAARYRQEMERTDRIEQNLRDLIEREVDNAEGIE